MNRKRKRQNLFMTAMAVTSALTVGGIAEASRKTNRSSHETDLSNRLIGNCAVRKAGQVGKVGATDCDSYTEDQICFVYLRNQLGRGEFQPVEPGDAEHRARVCLSIFEDGLLGG